MKKLTLSADPEVIAQAHRLAEQQGTSVSAIFSRLIRLLARQRDQRPPIGPLTRQASGLIEMPAGQSERDILSGALADKYGIDS
jgi:hypothetical protein